MWPNPQETTDLVTFTEEIFNRNFIFCAVKYLARSSHYTGLSYGKLLFNDIHRKKLFYSSQYKTLLK